VAETDGSTSVEFEWSALAALAVDEAGFLEALVAQAGGQYPQAERIAASAWLPPEHPRAAVLLAAGFAVTGGRQWFSADAAAWREALGVPPPWPDGGTLLRPLPEHYDALKGLLCGAGLRPIRVGPRPAQRRCGIAQLVRPALLRGTRRGRRNHRRLPR
jgi:hypothetical protein